MAGKDCYQGRFRHTVESLFTGDKTDLEICVKHLKSSDLTWGMPKLNGLYQQQGREKAR